MKAESPLGSGRKEVEIASVRHPRVRISRTPRAGIHRSEWTAIAGRTPIIHVGIAREEVISECHGMPRGFAAHLGHSARTRQVSKDRYDDTDGGDPAEDVPTDVQFLLNASPKYDTHESWDL